MEDMTDQRKFEILSAAEKGEIVPGDCTDEELKYSYDNDYLTPGLGLSGTMSGGPHTVYVPPMQMLPIGLTPKGKRVLWKLRRVPRSWVE